MSTTDLPDLYARVVAKRPELAVPHLSYRIWPGDPHDGRWLALDAWECESEIPEYMAAALILDRWLEALPQHYCLTHGGGRGPSTQWWVAPAGKETWCVPAERTPLEALAAFYLETTNHDAGGGK